MLIPKLPCVFYGGDYYPEQWPEEVWAEDMRLMKKAGVNLLSINVFNWVKLEPEEGTYRFDWLDTVMDMIGHNGIMVDLGTATAGIPMWLSARYPDVLPVRQDGIRFSYGSRQTYCPNSVTYRTKSRELAGRIAERYKDHPALAAWHVNNEISHHTRFCYCEVCAAGFREWLKKRYGSLDGLNEAWGTEFWGQLYTAWDQVIPPRVTTQQLNPTAILDFRRYMNDSFLGIYRNEAEELRRITPAIPLTATFPYEFWSLDFFTWGPHVDFVSVTTFPDPKPTQDPAEAALSHDLMRGLKNGHPFAVLEQAPSNVQWRKVNVAKRPGTMRLWSYQAMAHGADGLMFFQWRQGHHGPEKFHSAIVTNTGEEARIYREVCRLGRELEKLPELIGTRFPARVAMYFDYNTWWAVEYLPGPSERLKYLEQIKTYYYQLNHLNTAVDIVSLDADISGYRVVVAPLMYMLKPGTRERIERFVAEGGHFVTTFFSAMVDETDGRFVLDRADPLRAVLGLRVEEWDGLKEYMSNAMVLSAPFGELKGEYGCGHWCEVLLPDTATAIATYKQDYYAGRACVTENSFGKGKAYYIATFPEERFIRGMLAEVCGRQGVTPALDAPEGVEVTVRRGEDNEYIFALNHNEGGVEIPLPEGRFRDLITNRESGGIVEVEGRDLVILRKEA